jgi:hypothetical protein
MIILLGLLVGSAFAWTGGDHNPFEAVEKRVSDAVEDRSRRDQAEEVAEQIAEVYEERLEHRRSRMEQIVEVVKDRDVTHTAIVELSDQYDREVSDYQGRLVDLRFQLRERLTAAEWAEVFPVEPEEGAGDARTSPAAPDEPTADDGKAKRHGQRG